MRKLLSLMLIGWVALGCHAHACETKTIKIPTPASDLVYVGRDENLPKDSCYWFAVDDTGSANPRSLSEATDKVISVMPHWMRRALHEGRGINECVVVVNNADYLDVLIRFYIEKWRDGGVDMTNWRGEKRGGEPVFDPVVDAMQDMICRKVQH